jgi:hypothetical protein
MIGIVGEYLPDVQSGHGSSKDAGPTLLLYQHLFSTQTEAESLTRATCTVMEPAITDFEALHYQLTVRCSRSTELALPISYNAYTEIDMREPGGRQQRLRELHVPSDPRIVIRISSDKPEVLLVSLPTLWTTLF